MFQGCLKKVSSVFEENFTKSCCMDLIAATRAEGGLVLPLNKPDVICFLLNLKKQNVVFFWFSLCSVCEVEFVTWCLLYRFYLIVCDWSSLFN